MQRHELIEMMRLLKLFGMVGAFDEPRIEHLTGFRLSVCPVHENVTSSFPLQEPPPSAQGPAPPRR